MKNLLIRRLSYALISSAVFTGILYLVYPTIYQMCYQLTPSPTGEGGGGCIIYWPAFVIVFGVIFILLFLLLMAISMVKKKIK